MEELVDVGSHDFVVYQLVGRVTSFWR